MEEAFFSFTSESTARQNPVMELEIVPPTGGLEIGQILSSFNFHRLNMEKDIGGFFMHENIIYIIYIIKYQLCPFLYFSVGFWVGSGPPPCPRTKRGNSSLNFLRGEHKL